MMNKEAGRGVFRLPANILKRTRLLCAAFSRKGESAILFSATDKEAI